MVAVVLDSRTKGHHSENAVADMEVLLVEEVHYTGSPSAGVLGQPLRGEGLELFWGP